jgi:hypothetical protein
MALVTTPGASDANSYASLAEADAYFAARLRSTSWTDASDADQEAALIEAARILDAIVEWTGGAVDDVQVLMWPRTGMATRRGFPIPTSGSTSIPTELKQAQYELAIRLLEEDVKADNEISVEGITRLKAGPVELSFKDTIARKVLPDFVRELLPSSWYDDGSPTTTFRVL